MCGDQGRDPGGVRGRDMGESTKGAEAPALFGYIRAVVGAPVAIEVVHGASARRAYDPWVNALPPPVKPIPARRPPPPAGPPVLSGQPSSRAQMVDASVWRSLMQSGWVPLNDGLGNTYWWDTITDRVSWRFPTQPAGRIRAVEDVE